MATKSDNLKIDSQFQVRVGLRFHVGSEFELLLFEACQGPGIGSRWRVEMELGSGMDQRRPGNREDLRDVSICSAPR